MYFFNKVEQDADIMSLHKAAVEKYEAEHAAFCRMPLPPSRIYSTPGGIYVHTGTYAYFVGWEQIIPGDKKADILWWAQHLCDKTWSDTRLVSDFIDAAREHCEGIK